MEILDIVDQNDNIIGQAPKDDAYENKLGHRIVHVLIFNDQKKMVLQLRSANVSFCPLHWSTAVGGHVQAGETYEQAAIREYEEELNLASKLPETVAISFNPYIKVPTRWFEIPKRYEKKLLRVFIFTAMILGIAIYLSLYDYTAANDSKIYERYYFTKKTYTWQNINSAELEFKYYQPRQSDDTPEWRYSIELVLFKEGKKIYIWKDNGLANPTKEEIVWLLEKLKKENIPVVFAPVPTNTLQGLYQTNNDFRNIIYPALNSLITFTED